MPTNYPSGLDSFTTHHDGVNEAILAADVNKIQDAIAALETELGLTPKGSSADVAARLASLLKAASNLSDLASVSTARTNLGLGTAATISSTAGGDLSGTLPSPTVAKVNGVAVSGAPSLAGQVLAATGTTAAAWSNAAVVVDGGSATSTFAPVPVGSSYLSTAQIAADPALTGTYARKLYLDVREFGAVGDGTTDDSAAIRAAIQAQRTLRQAGSTVPPIWLDAKSYLCSTSLGVVDYTGFDMRGCGIFASRLIWNGSGALLQMGTYTSSGGYGGTAQDFSLRDLGIIGAAYIGSVNDGARLGIGVQDNGSGGARLKNVMFQGLHIGFNGAYASDFDHIEDCNFQSSDVGCYLGPGSQQVDLERCTFYFNVEGLVVEGVAQGHASSLWFVLNSTTDISIEGNATARSGVSGSASGAQYDGNFDYADCWFETNAGGLGRIAPRSVYIKGAPPAVIRHHRFDRVYLVSGGTNTPANTFLEINLTSQAADATEINGITVNGGQIGSIVKPTAGSSGVIVRDARAVDGFTLPSIFSSDPNALCIYQDRTQLVSRGGAAAAAVGNGTWWVPPYNQTTGTLTLNDLRAFPLYIDRHVKIQTFAIRVSTGSVSSAVVRVGIWKDSVGKPGALVYDSGAIDCSSPGTKTVTAGGLSLDSGKYWIGTVNQGAQATLYVNALSGNGQPGLSALTSDNALTLNLAGYANTAVSGSLPDPFNPTAEISSGNGARATFTVA